MKILFSNLALTSTRTTNYPNSNYPVDNLVDVFLKRRYQSSTSPTRITETLADDSTISSFFYGWHNLTSITVYFYDYDDALLYTLSITSPETKAGAEHFTAVENVSYMYIDITSASTPYLGGIGYGVCDEFGRPLGDFEEESVDNSVVEESLQSQTMSTYITPYGAESYTIPNITRDDVITMRDLMDATGVGTPIWFDIFYLNHDYRKPFYGRFTEPFSSQKDGRRFNVSISLQESN